MVFYELPSAQQVLQWGNPLGIINSTSNADSANIYIFEL